MNRISLNPGAIINGTRTYVIDAVIGNGATCIVYDAHYVDNRNYSHNVRLKECFPFGIEIERKEDNLVWENADDKANNLKTFANSYHKLMANQNGNFTVSAYDIFEANNTMYIVMDANEGETFDKCNLSIKEILNSVKLLTHVIGEYHKNGYLHLDVKPENFLVYPRPSEHIVLFDLDSVTSIEDIKSGKVQCVPYSKNWAAPEQMQGAINKLCPATDIFSIGATLFEKIIGRKVTNSDTGIFAEWDFDDNELLDKINPKIKRLLSEVFHKTLSANIKRRFQCTDELLSALTDMIAAVEQKQYLISDYIISDINFVGRNDDLNKMHSLFSNGTKAVFLHGFGGVGKTELARKYAEIYGKHYDCVKFERYSNGLKRIIDNIEIKNADTNDNNEHFKALKSVLNDSKALFIIDNFDVEDDEYLSTLLELNCQIIFTTRNDYSQYISSEKIDVIELESMPTDVLLQIFINEYGKEVSDVEKTLIEEIIEKFGNLTILVPIIAKQIVSSHISIEEFASSIENDSFARFDEENEDIRIRKDGQSQKTNSLDYLRAMFNIATLPEECITALKYLYLLRYYNKTELSVSDYRKYTNSKNVSVLNDLAFRNWITMKYDEYENDEMISVHQLILDLIEKDYYPTYDAVPGIAKHIEDCFKNIESYVDENNIFKQITLDWDEIKPLTFALLMYGDIQSTDSNRYTKSKILNFFACGTFTTSPDELFKLLFNSPDESTWYFHIHGIMDMISEDLYSEARSLLQLYAIENSKNLNDLLYEGNRYSFDSEEEKAEFLELMEFESREEAIFAQYGFVFSHLLIRSYFHYKSKETEQAQLVIFLLCYLELKRTMWNEKTENKDSSEFIQNILNLCFVTYKGPSYTINAERNHHNGFNVEDFYEYYLLIYTLIQNGLSIETNENVRKKYLNEAERIIISLDEANDKFSWYGMKEKDILEYEFANTNEHISNKKLHWSKKANKWYDSVDKTLTSTESPYAIYKLLLSFDYHNNILNNSKITKLISANLVNRIYEDKRLTDEQKEEVLIDHVIKQTHSSRIGKCKLNSFTKKHLPTLQLYFECLSKAEVLFPYMKERSMAGKIVALVDSGYIFKKFLKKEIFDLDSYVEGCIVQDNIYYIDELIYLADKVRMSGHIKKSQELKNKILDLCLNVNFSEIDEEIIQMILYKVRPLATKYNRQDVLSKIDELDINIERKYCLSLIHNSSLAIKQSEQSSIACKFMDKYIDCVAIDIYNKMHNGESIEFLDEMEQELIKYLPGLLFITEASGKYHYESIFENTSDESEISYRNLYPYWVLEFHSSNIKEVKIGICYLIAMTYHGIPTTYQAVNEALSSLFETTSYTITSDELKVIMDNILELCPQASEEVNAFRSKAKDVVEE